MPLGFQDLWVAGSRFFYSPNATGANDQPWIDLGKVETVSPNFNVTKVDCKDGELGVRGIIDTRTILQVETYDVKTNNLSLRNLALLFRSNPVALFSQSVAAKDVVHHFHPGRLVKLVDVDGTNIFVMAAIGGVYAGSPGVASVTSVTTGAAGACTIVVSNNLSGANPAVGSRVILKGNNLTAGKETDCGTYTIASKSGSGPTTLTVSEVIPFADTPSGGGTLLYNTGGAEVLFQGPNQTTPAWTIVDINDGIIRPVEGGAISVEQDLHIVYVAGAIASGSRLVLPQTQLGTLQGQAMVFWKRNTGAEESVRLGRVSISPNAASITAKDFADMTLTVQFLTDLTAGIANSDGLLYYYQGAVPSLS